MKRLRRILLLLTLILLLINLIGCTATGKDKSSTEVNNNSSNSTVIKTEVPEVKLSDAKLEAIAKDEVLEKILWWLNNAKSFKDFDIPSTRYDIGSIDKRGSKYTVYITVYLYDKYGKLGATKSFSPVATVYDNGDVMNVTGTTFFLD